jgi:hypothetical protein
VTNDELRFLMLFMCFLVFIIAGSLVVGHNQQQQGSPTAPLGTEVNRSATIPTQRAPRAEPVNGDIQYSGDATKPDTRNGESQDSTHAPGKGNHQTSANPSPPNTKPSQSNAELHFATMNEVILDILVGMPKGGGYDASSNGMSVQMLSSAVHLEANRLAIEPEKATPSFCSSATYLVFLSVLDRINREGHLTISPEVMEKLLVRGQSDGVGIWGRWNANGPGTARLFEELHLGKNFTSFEEARPGDFMKIFWNDNIGLTESGHSVIYLGRGSPSENGDETVRIWSSNKPDGYGPKEIPVSKIRRAIFSRLEDPRKIEGALALPRKDLYLAELQRRTGTVNEMLEEIGMPPEATPRPTQAASMSQSPKPNRPNDGTNQRDGKGEQLPATSSASQEKNVLEDTDNAKQVPAAKAQEIPGSKPPPTPDDR